MSEPTSPAQGSPLERMVRDAAGSAWLRRCRRRLKQAWGRLWWAKSDRLINRSCRRYEALIRRSSNDPKLSDCPARRDGCVGEGGGAAGVTRGAVRSSAWLGVAVEVSEALISGFVATKTSE